MMLQLRFVVGVELGKEIKFVVVAKEHAIVQRNTRLLEIYISVFVLLIWITHAKLIVCHLQAIHWRSSHKAECQKWSNSPLVSDSSSSYCSSEIPKGEQNYHESNSLPILV